MNNLKGLIFDFDGTLADTLPLCILSFQQAFEGITGKKYDEETIVRHFGKSEEGIVRAILPEFYEEALNAYIQKYKDNHHLCPDVFDGIKDILDEISIRGIKTSLITGKGENTINAALEFMDLKKYFEFVEHGDPNGSVKTKAIKKIAGLWGMDTSKIAYIGDQPSDIIESKEAGAVSIAVSWARTSNYELLKSYSPDFIFTDVQEFKNWLGKSYAEVR